jgi:hypothetical protein
MNKILEEGFLELEEENSAELSKILDYLEMNEPNVKASIEFKENLRNRLNNIIEFKLQNRKRFWNITIPAFAFCFVLL